MKKIFFIITIALLSAGFISAQNQTGTFTDTRDGKVYKTVKIGDNWWFAENLDFKTDSSWLYGGNSANEKTYGRLYTLKAAEKACPAGWHLATEAEWSSLSSLKNENITGGKLKTKNLWQAPNTGADNSMNFNGVPGGYRSPEGKFTDLGKIATFWSSTKASGNTEWRIYLLYNNSGIERGMDLKTHGFSVRCVKNK